MMVHLREMVEYLDAFLEIEAVPADKSNNGLQVEGRAEVTKAVFGVDACAGLFKEAVRRNADFIFVHHGISWGDSLKRLTGLNASRLRPLFNFDISLYAAHLPLDAHRTAGHNARLADMIGIENKKMFSEYSGAQIGVYGNVGPGIDITEIVDMFNEQLGTDCRLFKGTSGNTVSRVGIISGGAGSSGIMDAVELGLDLFVTGEVGHESYHIIKESGINVLALGHYSSETPGVRAVMEEISGKFDVECFFADIPTGL
jgi:dinuclear metal center YbgI/SA1388 family protein